MCRCVAVFCAVTLQCPVQSAGEVQIFVSLKKPGGGHCVLCILWCSAQEQSALCVLHLLDTEKSCVLHLLDNVFCICLTRRIIVFCILLYTEKNCVCTCLTMCFAFALHGEELCFALAWQCVLHLLDTEKKLGGARSAEAGSTVSGVLQSCRQQQSEIISWDPSQDRLFDSNNLRISYNWPN